MEREAVFVNIISSCICRDAFEIGKRALMTNKFQIDLFYQAICPFTLYSKRDDRLLKIEEEDLTFGTPWQRRIIVAEFRANLFERLGDEKRDSFLILDFTDYARGIYRLNSSDDAYILQTDLLRKNQEVINQCIKDVIYPWQLPQDQINKCLDLFIEDITKRYDRDKIILVEAYYSSEYLTRNGIVMPLSEECAKVNEFIKYCYEYFKNRVSGIHLIRTPDNALSYELHKWGVSSRHFCNEYYEYLLSAMDLCMCGYPTEEEAEALDLLFDNVEKRFSQLREISRLKKEVLAGEEKRKELAQGLEREIEKSNELSKEVDSLRVERSINKRLSYENKYLKGELEGIKLSKSYKIGRFLTYVPRKLRRGK